MTDKADDPQPEEITAAASKLLAQDARARIESLGGVFDPVDFREWSRGLWAAALNRAQGDTRRACVEYGLLALELVSRRRR
jgi:hypothetical protein